MVFLQFFFVFHTIAKVHPKTFCNWLRRPKNSPLELRLALQGLPWTPTWRPRASQGPQLGRPRRSQTPKLEAQSYSRTPTWRPKAVQDVNLEAQGLSKAQFWRPKALQQLNLEVPGTPTRCLWQPKPSSEEQNFEELNLRWLGRRGANQ